MSLDFLQPDDQFTYAKRNTDESWIQFMKEMINFEGKKVLDIGCGGGIYTKAIAEMGAAQVIGVDFSEKMLSAAKEYCQGYDTVQFIHGNAIETGLDSDQFDIVLERALIHHIRELEPCFYEVFRLLKPGGTCIIQDRTPEDCLLEGSPTHIRGYFFSMYPQLIEKEVARRHSSEEVIRKLQHLGFQDISENKLWEIRRVYEDHEDLWDDLRNRTGRSILHELNDQQLNSLIKDLQLTLKNCFPLIEKDRWTVWSANKNS